MNIVEYLKKENNSHHLLKYYGLGDMATGITAKYILNDIKLIEKYSLNLTYKINDINDYINFAFFSISIRYKEVIEYINDGEKENFINAISIIEKIYSNYSFDKVIKYVIKNYKSIIDYEEFDDDTLFIKYDMREFTFEFCINHMSKELKESNYFNYLIEKDVCFCFDNVYEFMKIDTKYLNLILSDDNIKILFEYRLDELLEYLVQLRNNKDNKQFISNVITKTYNYILCELNNSNTHIYSKCIMCNNLIKFLDKTNDYRINYVKKLEDKLLEEQNKELKANGHTFKYELSSARYLEKIFNNPNYNDTTKYVLLTHGINNGKYESILEFENNNLKKSLTDYVASSKDNDNYFIWSRINVNELFLQQGFINLMCWFNENAINLLWSNILGCINEIYQRLNIDFDVNELEKDIQYLQIGINNYIKIERNNIMSINFYSFMLSSYIFSLIEKILRNIYIVLNPYCPIKKIQLAPLLKDKGYLQEILGKHTQNLLLFYLSKNDNLVGKDTRNKVMHYCDILVEDFNEQILYENIFLLIVMINSIIFNLKNKDEESE